MVVKSKKKSAAKRKNVKVLSLKKETVKNLKGSEAKRVKGGIIGSYRQPPANTSFKGWSEDVKCVGVSVTQSMFGDSYA